MPTAIINGEVVEVSQQDVDESYVNFNREQIVRQDRDTLLAETDWWAMSDRTMTQAETDYRQALRDVPAQAGFPENVTWPTKPE